MPIFLIYPDKVLLTHCFYSQQHYFNLTKFLLHVSFYLNLKFFNPSLVVIFQDLLLVRSKTSLLRCKVKFESRDPPLILELSSSLLK